ncbi:hypothetical protein AMTRI_Chr07g26590 [Amborella trichopoda]
MFVKMRTTYTSTERPYEALLFPGIGFGPFLRSLGGGRRRPPSGGARSINEIPLWKMNSNIVSGPMSQGTVSSRQFLWGVVLPKYNKGV